MTGSDAPAARPDNARVEAAEGGRSVQIMVDRIVERFHPLRVILFGSRARGTAGPQSDVDLLVVLAQVADRRRAAVEIRRVLRDLPVSKDIIVTTPEELVRRAHIPGSILGPAVSEGRVVYERE